MSNDKEVKKVKMTITTNYDKITGWATYKKDEPMKEFTYEAAALQPNDVEVKISHCGMCGSDIHTIDSGWGVTNYPCIPGHEIVGHVTAKGDKVTELQIGDRVGVGAQVAACLQSDCTNCSQGQDAQCPKMAWTYNDNRFIDGSKTYGGYAEAIRVQADYVFKLPESLPSEYAAPLLCAGATVFSPMLRYNFKSGDKVGVVGIGGLGHLALKFAKGLGCEVTALSRSDSKRKDALEIGVDHYIAYQDKEQNEKVKNSLDFLIVACKLTGDRNQWFQFNSWMKLQGRIILLDIPECDLAIPPTALLAKNLSLSGSLIASIGELRTMLDFAANHDIKPIIETFKLKDVNQAIQHFRDGKPKFRVVLEIE